MEPKVHDALPPPLVHVAPVEVTEFSVRPVGIAAVTDTSVDASSPVARTTNDAVNAVPIVACGAGVVTSSATSGGMYARRHDALFTVGVICAMLHAENWSLPLRRGAMRKVCGVLAHAPVSPSCGALKLWPISCAAMSAAVTLERRPSDKLDAVDP